MNADRVCRGGEDDEKEHNADTTMSEMWAQKVVEHGNPWHMLRVTYAPDYLVWKGWWASLSHHQTLYVLDENNELQPVGYRRITNDGEVLSIWMAQQQILLLPEALS